VHFLRDDDLLAVGALGAPAGALQAVPDAGGAFGQILLFGDRAAAGRREQEYFRVGAERMDTIHTRLGVVIEMLFTDTPLVDSAFTIRGDCTRGIGGSARTVRIVEEVDFYLRAIRRVGFVRVDAQAVHYRVGNASIMHSLTDRSVVNGSYGEIHSQYRRDHGRLKYQALRTFHAACALVRRLRGHRRARPAAPRAVAAGSRAR
jgi:hypothetical protein